MKMEICETLASGLAIGWGCGHFTSYFKDYEIVDGITMGNASIVVGILAILIYVSNKSIDHHMCRSGNHARRKSDKTIT